MRYILLSCALGVALVGCRLPPDRPKMTTLLLPRLRLDHLPFLPPPLLLRRKKARKDRFGWMSAWCSSRCWSPT